MGALIESIGGPMYKRLQQTEIFSTDPSPDSV